MWILAKVNPIRTFHCARCAPAVSIAQMPDPTGLPLNMNNSFKLVIYSIARGSSKLGAGIDIDEQAWMSAKSPQQGDRCSNSSSRNQQVCPDKSIRTESVMSGFMYLEFEHDWRCLGLLSDDLIAAYNQHTWKQGLVPGRRTGRNSVKLLYCRHVRRLVTGKVFNADHAS